MKKTLLIVDATCPKPYDPSTFLTEGMGGTEGTVLRIAEALSQTYRVRVEQHNRTSTGAFQALYLPPECVVNADIVVSLRYPQLIPLMQKRFPNATHLLWNHDLLTPQSAQEMMALSNFTAIAVSEFHKTQMQQVLRAQGYTGQFQIKVVYNPIADDLAPDSTPVDLHKLIWISSPHKGLDNALNIFRNLRGINPDFRMYIANPGYLPCNSDVRDGVFSLGVLPHSDVINHLHSSLVLFYPNSVFPETFGIALAEANAVGTPVITQAIGAAREVLCHPYETIECRVPKLLIDRVIAWSSGDRPRVKANPKFRLSNVLKSWMRVLT